MKSVRSRDSIWFQKRTLTTLEIHYRKIRLVIHVALAKFFEHFLEDKKLEKAIIEKNMATDVPQGLVLGPTLWNV